MTLHPRTMLSARQRAVAKLRSGEALDPTERDLLLEALSATPRRGVGAERIALRDQHWPVPQIARAAGRSVATVKQSLRRERRKRERLQREAQGGG